MRDGLCNHRIRLNGYLDLGSLLQLNFVPVSVRQSVWNSNLAVQMVGTLNGNLSFLGLAGIRMGMNYFLDFSWERSACF